MRKNLPDKNIFINKHIPNRQDILITGFVNSGNDAYLFKGNSNTLRRDVAVKIIPRGNLQIKENGEETWRSEVHKADALRNPTVVKFEYVIEWVADDIRIDCVALISEFVEGPNLRTFMQTNSDEVDIPFIRNWLSTLLNLFNEMKLKKINHGDLHAGNIIVEDRSSYDLLGPKYVFRVTDFGVAEATSDARFKDDFHQLADMLSEMLALIDFQKCSPKDKYAFNVLRHHFISRHLIEIDPTIDPIARDPYKLLQKLQSIDLEFERNTTQSTVRMETPFDFLSCEYIGDATYLLYALYSDRFLGLDEIESQNNIVVTGPRGCGKSTVFKCLSLYQKIRANKAGPDDIRYIGIYYRCDDLYFAFPRYTNSSRGAAIDIPIHFATATLLAKLLDVLEEWAHLHFNDEFTKNELNCSKELWTVLSLNPPQKPGYATFKEIVSTLNRQRDKAIERQKFVHDEKRELGNFFGVDILQNFCKVLRTNFSFIRERPIYFFIDDYSSPKVTKDLQINLNRLFMQRTSLCFFKLSTESPVSFAKNDIDGKVFVENREFRLLNMGLKYLHSETDSKLSFIEDIFSRRLAESKTKFPVDNLEGLIGTNKEFNNNSFARQIRDKSKKTASFFWGKEILCQLCSGDIHYIISLVSDMVNEAGGTDGLHKIVDNFKISPDVQQKTIRQAAGAFLNSMRSVPFYGEKLVSIVESFGNVAFSHMKYLDSKNDKQIPPKQATRIEPYEPLMLNSEAQALYDELLRYSIFIEDYRGKSRRGKIVPRLFLRRLFVPHFNLSFNTRDSIELEPSEFQTFLLDQKEFEKKFLIKSAEEAIRFRKKSIEPDAEQTNFLEGLNDTGNQDSR
jgi:energy-coupling factor transporter ATP-binding protein EcfA2